LKSTATLIAGSSNPLHLVDAASSARRVAPLAVDSHAVRIVYSFPQDKRDNSVWGALPLFDGDVFHVNDVANVLVQDHVNLRTIGEVRYWHQRDRAFVAAPADGLLPRAAFVDKYGAMKLQFVVGHARSLLGPSFVVDPNVGVVLDTLNPIVRFRFDAAGQVVSRVYRAFIHTIGPRLDLSVRFQAAFVMRLPFAPAFTQAPIALGRGIDICWGLCITIASFRDTDGFLLLVGVPLGLSVGASFIRGGSLVPLVHPENEPDFLVERIRVAEADAAAAKAAAEQAPTTTVVDVEPVSNNIDGSSMHVNGNGHGQQQQHNHNNQQQDGEKSRKRREKQQHQQHNQQQNNKV
jgi:hypothetical protein